MKEMMSFIKNDKKEPSGQSNDEKKKKREERRKKYNDAPVCNIAAKNIPPKRKTSVGNSKSTKTLDLPTGNQQRALEGAWGP
jgi:hypothetical protein